MTTAWDDAEVGAGTSVWTVEGDKEKALGEDGEDLSDNEDGDDSTKVSLKITYLEIKQIHNLKDTLWMVQSSYIGIGHQN